MSVEELDRIVAGLPEWEGSPAPVAGGTPDDAIKEARQATADWRVQFAASRADAVYREQEAKLRLINRTERVVWVLVVSLAAGMAVAGYVHAVMGPPKQAEFLREKP
jgi:hypothetical protein